MVPGPSSEPEAVEQALRDLPEMELLGLLRRSSNYTFLAALRASGSEEAVLAVYKPAQGETPLWDFTRGTLYRREVAAYLLAKRLGWPRIPPTVIREAGPHGAGALQLFVEGRPALPRLAGPRRSSLSWLQIAVFDVLANNADRKSGHCLQTPDGAVWAIDHGLTFHAEPKLRTVLWDFAGEAPPEALLADVGRVLGEMGGGDLGACLGGLLSRVEVRALRRRLREALMPGWQLPHPTSAWSVPWPPA